MPKQSEPASPDNKRWNRNPTKNPRNDKSPQELVAEALKREQMYEGKHRIPGSSIENRYATSSMPAIDKILTARRERNALKEVWE